MEHAAALHHLPEAHGRALVLEAQGLDARQIASRLDLDVTSVGPLLRVARAKIAALEALEEPEFEGERKPEPPRRRGQQQRAARIPTRLPRA